MIVFGKSIIERSEEVFSDVHSITSLPLVPERRNKRVILHEWDGLEQWWVKNFHLVDHRIKIFWDLLFLRFSILSIHCASWFSFLLIALIFHKKILIIFNSWLHFAHLAMPDFSLDNFSFDFFTVWTVAEVLNVRRFERGSWVSMEFLLNFMNAFESLFIMLALDDSGFIFLVHALDSLTSVSLKILIARNNWVFDVDNFLFSEIFEIDVFGSIDLFLVFAHFHPHFLDKIDSNGV